MLQWQVSALFDALDKCLDDYRIIQESAPAVKVIVYPALRKCIVLDRRQPLKDETRYLMRRHFSLDSPRTSFG